MLKDLSNTQNFTQNMSNLSHFEDFYTKMNDFGGQMGYFGDKIDNFNVKKTKNK